MSVTESATGEVVQIASHDHAAHLAAKIDDLVVRVNRISGELVEVIAEALRLRAWVALGYGSWERMVEQRGWEFTPRTSTDRAALATVLRESGMSYRAIGKLVGSSPQTVMRDTTDATVPDGTVHGLDGKRRPAEFTGEATDREAVGVESEDVPSSPTFDPGEAALGDDAERPPQAPPNSPGSTTSPTAQPEAGAAGNARPALHRQVKAATVLFTAWQPEQIHALNDPELTRSFELLLPIVGAWFEEFTRTEPTGLTVIEGGRQ